MTVKNSPWQATALGAGISLFSSRTVARQRQNRSLCWSEGNFKSYRLYALGDQAFCVGPGLVANALIPVKLLRMEDIRQLQLLTSMCVDGRAKRARRFHTFPHNRLIHNLRAGALHGIIGQACGLSQNELDIGILADSMHDVYLRRRRFVERHQSSKDIV